ncbi:hypothetical protein CCP2SC5_2440003 [Azospirillaceae bacterium]
MIILSHLSETQKKALRIADNKLALGSGWDADLLRLEIEELQETDFNIDIMGFSPEELYDLLGAADTEEGGGSEEDDAPEPPVEPISRPGDLWILGRHRLICGDSTDADTVKRVLNGVTPHLMVTDPPYGVKYDAGWRNNAVRADGSIMGGRAVEKS